MGTHSNLGPFDPQIGGMPAQAIKEEYDRAVKEILANQQMAFIWQPMLQKLSPGFITATQHAIAMAEAVVRNNLSNCMFAGDPNAAATITQIIDELGSNRATQTHSRHIHRDKAKALGLKILDLESDPAMQDAVLSVHHAAMITFEQAGAFKMIENHAGSSYIQQSGFAVLPT